MSTAIATRPEASEAALIERLVVEGDLSKLSAPQRIEYYYAMCHRAGLDPLSQPLQYLRLSGKMVLYFTRAATDQIARNHKLSRRIVRAEMVGTVYLVVAECSDPSGRVEQSTGAVSTQGLAGENLVNAMLKAETKAKRRAVLSATGLGAMDESEAESIPGAVKVALEHAHQEPQRQLTQGAKPKASDPAPAAWRQELLDLATEIWDSTGDEHVIPDTLTCKEAWELKGRLETALAAPATPFTAAAAAAADDPR